jgi:hypothetical protein
MPFIWYSGLGTWKESILTFLWSKYKGYTFSFNGGDPLTLLSRMPDSKTKPF